jgi:alpha-tubulin suppressor-like RCC1 family protein
MVAPCRAGQAVPILALLVACTVDPIPIEGRPCPCPDEYVCERGSCRARVASSDAGLDALPDSAPACAAATPLRTIASGRRHVCAIKAGSLYCWGDNQGGELGIGTTQPQPTPVAVALPGRVVHVSSFDSHTCALLEDRRIYCWGANQHLQSGRAGGQPVLEPTQVGQNFDFITVSTGSLFTCALGTSPFGGTVPGLVCWGTRNGGTLGDQQYTGPPTESPVSAFGETEFVDVRTGLGHGCAVKADGRVFCWGYVQCNQYGEPVSAKPIPALASCAVELAVETGASCFIDGNADLYCLGGNAEGGLGIGSAGGGRVIIEPDGAVLCTEVFDDPQPVLRGTRWARIFGGMVNACALTRDEKLYCWGSNEFRAVSAAPVPVVSEPMEIGEGRAFRDVAVGFQQICARPVDSERVFCRGVGVGAADAMVEIEFFSQ